MFASSPVKLWLTRRRYFVVEAKRHECKFLVYEEAALGFNISGGQLNVIKPW
jgi:hypothetical protein